MTSKKIKLWFNNKNKSSLSEQMFDSVVVGYAITFYREPPQHNTKATLFDSSWASSYNFHKIPKSTIPYLIKVEENKNFKASLNQRGKNHRQKDESKKMIPSLAGITTRHHNCGLTKKEVFLCWSFSLLLTTKNRGPIERLHNCLKKQPSNEL